MRYRRALGPIALALAVAMIVGASAASRALPIYSVKRDNKAVSLTFDAAWDDVRVRRLKTLDF